MYMFTYIICIYVCMYMYIYIYICIPGALLDLVSLHDLAQGGAVARTVLAGDADL